MQTNINTYKPNQISPANFEDIKPGCPKDMDAPHPLLAVWPIRWNQTFLLLWSDYLPLLCRRFADDTKPFFLTFLGTANSGLQVNSSAFFLFIPDIGLSGFTRESDFVVTSATKTKKIIQNICLLLYGRSKPNNFITVRYIVQSVSWHCSFPNKMLCGLWQYL